MNWEIVSATGEWAGAIAVVASLLYLARQIRLSNQQSQASARYSFLEAYGQANTAISGTKQTASLFRRGLSDELKDDDEKMQFIVMLGQFLNTWSVMYDLHEEGQLPRNQWELVSSDLHAAFGTVGGGKFWNEIGRPNVHSNFASYVDNLLENEEPVYEILPGNT